MKLNLLTNYFLFIVSFEKIAMKYVLVRINQNRYDIGTGYRQFGPIGMHPARNYQ